MKMKSVRQARCSGRYVTMCRMRSGFAAMLALIFMALCAAMAAGLYSLVQSSTAIAGNERRVAKALGATETGLQFFQYEIGQAVKTTGAALTAANTDPWMASLRDNLALALDGSNGITDANVIYTPGESPVPYIITFPKVPFGSDAAFIGKIVTDAAGASLFLEVTGTSGTVARKARVGVTITPRNGVGPVRFPLLARVGIPYAWNVTPDGDTKVQEYGTPTPITLTDGTTSAGLVYPGMILPGTPIDFPNNDALIAAVAGLNLPAKILKAGSTISGTDGNYTIPAGKNYTITGVINGVIYVEWPNNITLDGNLSINGSIVFQRKGTMAGKSTVTLRRNGVIERSMDAADAQLMQLSFTGNDQMKWWTLIAPDADLSLPNGTVWDTTKAFEGSLHFKSVSRAGSGNDCGFVITKGGMVAEGSISLKCNGAAYTINTDTSGLGGGTDGSASLAWTTYDEPLN